MKQKLLTLGCMTLLVAGSMAQTLKVQPQPVEQAGQPQTQAQSNTPVIRCSSINPGAAWDAAFNAQVEQYKQDLLTGKASAATYTIAVVFHVIHNNETKGGATSYNLSQAQINSQIAVLNADYSGTGLNANTYPATAFQGYCSAATNSVSASSIDGNGRVAIANTGITFCLATKDPNGVTLAEPGIDRIDRNTKGWTAPPFTQAYCDATIKPGSIWDPHKYYNIWTCNLGGGLLGYATFPAASGLTGIPGSTGSLTTDGVVLLGSAVGNTGYQSISQYNKGRSCSHETGHWLGLRHIWGDNGQCGATDYCNDTPPAKGQTNSPPGCYYGCPTYPSQAASCTFGGQTNTNGDMFMNFMDYTDDACMYMFTNDQKTRMQTAMANGTYRAPLTGNAVTLCNVTVITPVADFTYPGSICANANIQFTDASTGPPNAWAWTVNPNTGVVITTASSQNPTINFPAAGTYTVSLNASNSQGNNTKSHVVTVTACAAVCDTLSNINNTDTLAMYLASGGGYWTGTNAYQFSDIAEFYQKTQFSSNLTQVNGGIILFYRNGVKGTKGTGTVTLSMVNSSSGPGSTVLASKAFTISTATATPATNHVDYAGNPALSFGSNIIIPYVAMFPTPGALSADFFLSLTVPTGGTDTVAVLTGRANHSAPTNTAWIKYQGSWLDLKSATTGTANPNGTTYNIGIIPIACPLTGIQGSAYLGHNINLFPNPSSGVFNFAVALNHATNLNFTVVNTLGQTVFTRTETNFVNGVLTYDLSGFGKGVYFVQITDSENNKTVKKIMIE